MLGMNFYEWFSVLLFFGIPVVAIILFVVSLLDYRKANRLVRVDPGSLPKEKLSGKRILTIVLGVIAGCLTLGVVGVLLLAYMAVAYM